jgi:hypothetical protein
VHTVEQLARRDPGQEKLLLLPAREMRFQTHTLVLDQDAGVDQDAPGSRTSVAESTDLAEARSLANSSASISDNLGREASRPGKDPSSATGFLPRTSAKRCESLPTAPDAV